MFLRTTLQRGITLLFINLDNTTAVEVSLSIKNAILVKETSQKTEFERITRDKKATYQVMREEYHLTPEDGDLHSQIMLLNGKALTVNSSGIIPSLEPRRVNLSDPLTVSPFSIVFAQIPSIHVPACI